MRLLNVVIAVLVTQPAVSAGLDARLAGDIAQVTRRDGSAVEITQLGAMKTLHFSGTFQNVMLAKVAADELVLACVDDLPQASAFFGRDLASQGLDFRNGVADSAAQVAAQHGMSIEEFLRYSQMIHDAQSPQSARAPAAFTIVNQDGVGEGFNDTAAAFANAPGNSGTTLGGQRLALFAEAARIWGQNLDATVNIRIGANFDPLTCTASSAVLGSAGAAAGHIDFANAPEAGTIYHGALANKIAGSDLSPGVEINARFNGTLDSGGCLGGRTFYYGFDNATPSNTVNLLVVLLHEFGHGLGSSTFANAATGALNGGFLDVWSTRMFDKTVAKFWSQMTDAERQTSAMNNGNLVWDSPSMRIAAPAYLTAAVDGVGRVNLFAPTTFQPGSSVSHFDSLASPNLLMEPAINLNLPLSLDLTRQQFRDIGWSRDSNGDVTPDTIVSINPSGSTLTAGLAQTISWTNAGGFNKNITLEFSANGGVTFTAIAGATDLSNTGSFSWTVPNIPTTQGRIRVRETSFASPAGISGANFSIISGTTDLLFRNGFEGP
jgi:hypothetical protein